MSTPRPSGRRRVEIHSGTIADLGVAVLGVTGFLLASVGVGVGLGGDASEIIRRTEGKFWLFVTGLQGAYLLVMVGPLWARYVLLVRSFSVAPRHVRSALLSAVALLFLIVVPLGIAGRTWPPALYPYVRIGAFLGAGLFGALPAVLGVKTIQFIAGEVEPGAEQYFALRRELRRFLVFLGSMVSLLVIDSGAFRNALNAVAPDSASSQAVLFYGALFAAALAALYVPAYIAVQALGRRLLDRACPMPPIDDPAVADALDRRAKLSSYLNVEGGTARQNLEEGTIVLAPLITAIVSASFAQ